MNLGDTQKKILTYKRTCLTKLLNQCSVPQQELFKRIYPKGVPESKFNSAFDLVERTIIKNLKGRIEVES